MDKQVRNHKTPNKMLILAKKSAIKKC